MRIQIQLAILLVTIQQIFAFSKYGRSCKDIGCLSSEVCVMAEDPCSYYNRDQCGSYPTCKSAGGSTIPSCEKFACPPTQICHLDNGTPKCVPARSTSTHVQHSENTNTGSNTNNNPSYPAQNPSYPAQNPSYPAQNPSYPAQNPSYPPQNPSYPPQNPSYPSQPSAPNYPGQINPSYPGQAAPSNPSGGLYPSLTTSRPAQGGSYPSQGGGYAGGAPGSGYPGGATGSGYPGYSGYPQQNNRGYPNQGYPSPGAYPGYPNQGYPQYPQGQYPGYPNQGYNNRQGGGYGNQPYGGNRYGSSSSQSGSNPIVDKITDQLKTIGAGLLKNALGLNKQ